MTADNPQSERVMSAHFTVFQADAKRVFTSDTCTEGGIPQSVVVLGGGYIGCEFATYFRAFGVDVTTVESCRV